MLIEPKVKKAFSNYLCYKVVLQDISILQDIDNACDVIFNSFVGWPCLVLCFIRP